MLFSIHATPERVRQLQARQATDPEFAQWRAQIHELLAGPNALDLAKPGLVNAPQADPYSLGHLGSALAVYHAVEPSAAVERLLLDFLRWIPGQQSLMWGQNISLGQFLKGAVLAMDAVGEQLPAAERLAILEHLTLFCIENPDPEHISNRHPTGAQPMRHYLEIPGFGFHLKDEQVNNWDVVCGQGLLYMARALEAVCPARAETAQAWRDIAVVRLRRFLELAFAPEGEYGEGPSYYSYGNIACVLMLDCLATWPGLDLKLAPHALRGLYASPAWSRELYHGRLEDGRFNINDSSVNGYESPAVVHWLAARARNEEAQFYGDELRRLNLGTVAPEELAYSFLWRETTLAGRRPHGRKATNFGRLGTVVCRQGYAPEDAHFTIRAGDHAGAHTHPDRGNMLLTMYGENLLADAGMPADRSIAAYFPWHRSTAAHNCLVIGRQNQLVETDHGYVSGRITRYEAQPAGTLVTADCGAVWPQARRVLRHAFIAWQGWVLVCDQAEVDKGPVELIFHTDNHDRRAGILVQADAVVFQRPKASLWLLYGAGLSGALDEGTHYGESDPDGMRSVRLTVTGPEAVYLLLPRRAAHPVPMPGAVLLRLANGSWKVPVDGLITTVALPPA
ncbi:MAG: heparinase II/III family protein [bacterium]